MATLLVLTIPRERSKFSWSLLRGGAWAAHGSICSGTENKITTEIVELQSLMTIHTAVSSKWEPLLLL